MLELRGEAGSQIQLKRVVMRPGPVHPAAFCWGCSFENINRQDPSSAFSDDMSYPWDLIPRLGLEDFKGQTLERDGDWAVCFAADWCPYCRAFLTRFAELKEEAATRGFDLAMGDMEDYESPLWDQFDLEVVPVLVAFRDGKIIWRRDGAPGVGLEEKDLEALCRALTGSSCDPEASEEGVRFGAKRPERRS